jgi:hypothetical protein
MLMADVTGSILGIVKDSSGAVIPNVKIAATNQETNLTQSTVSDLGGQYRLLALPVGKYRLEATADGFQRFAVTDIVLEVNQQRTIDITLQVGNVQTEISVQASALAVETTSSQLGEVISERKIMSLPLNGRSYIDLLGLQAGVVPVSSGSVSGTNVSGNLAAGNVSVNGQRETSNSFMVNGADVNEGRSMGASVIPNLDSVAEFRLITNSFDAEYGRFSGAVMNAVTKSGSNSFHGSAFEFLRNDKMDARNFFDPQTKGVLKRNQFGYSAGGPLWKNKIFWFTDYQGTRQVQGISTGLVTVPSASARGGDLSSDNNFIKGGATVTGSYWAQILSGRLGYGVTDGERYTSATCVTTAQCVFPGGIIPAKALSSAAVGTLKLIPLPNTGVSGYTTSSQNQRINDDKMGQRVDVNTKTWGNWYSYYHFDDSSVFNPLQGSSAFPGFAGIQPTRAQLAVLANTKVFGPTTVNEARLSFTRMKNINNIPTSGFSKVSDYGFLESTGLGIFPSYPPYEGVPRIGLQNFSFGMGGGRIQADNTWMGTEDLSKVMGKHTLKLGGEFRYLQINERNITSHNGQFSFDGSETGSDFADYLLGAPSQYIQASLQIMDTRSHYGGAFAQDSWRVTPNLTVNMGVRWEFSQFWYDTQDKIQTIVRGQQSTVFPNSPRGWVFPGDAGVPRTLAPTGWNNFSPRLGIAYSPSVTDGFLGKLFGGPGKSSIRVGAGRYFTAVEDATMFVVIADAPFGLFWVSQAPPMFDQPFLTRATGKSQTQRFPFTLPTPGDPATKNIDFSIFLPISSSPAVDTHAHLPYAMHFNFTIQRQIARNTTITLAYVGTQGRKLPVFLESNPGSAPLCLSLTGSGVKAGTLQCGPNREDETYTRPDGSKVYSTRPNFSDVVINGQPAFAGTNAYIKTMAYSHFNSFQASVEHRAGDLTFLAAYTRGKAIDSCSGFNCYENFTNFALSRGLSRFDIQDNFVLSYNWALPLDRLGSLKPLTHGWSINGITRFAGGFPIQLSQTGDRALAGSSGVDVPNFVGPLVIQDPRLKGPTGKANMYFDKAGFTSEVIGTFGTSSRSFFHGPGFNNFDIGLHKDTKIHERAELQIRAELFNAFNHAQFNNPNGSFTNSNFGFVTSARSPRIGQVSAKILW